jgi:hypothetical protein
MLVYSIFNALALFFGVASIAAVARSLPEQRRSEINARGSGGDGFGKPLTDPEDTKVGITVPNDTKGEFLDFLMSSC